MLVFIPLHPISAKIIATEYAPFRIDEDENIPIYKFTAYDSIFHFIHVKMPEHITHLRKKKILLTTGIYLDPTYTIDHADNIGYSLYIIHRSLILSMAWAKYNAGVNGTQALITTLQNLDITVDDIDYDSMARAWRRFLYGKPKKKHKDFEYKVTRIRSSITKQHIPECMDDLDRKICSIVKDNLDQFFTTGGRFNKRLLYQIRCYTLYHFGRLNQSQISKIVSSKQQSVSRAIIGFQNIMDTDPSIISIYSTYFRTA